MFKYVRYSVLEQNYNGNFRTLMAGLLSSKNVYLNIVEKNPEGMLLL